MNLNYKNIAKNGPNSSFLEPKMVLDFIFDGFSCISMVCIIRNLKIPGGYPTLGNIKRIYREKGDFCNTRPSSNANISS